MVASGWGLRGATQPSFFGVVRSPAPMWLVDLDSKQEVSGILTWP
jgi:hypothetical protein